MTELELAYTVLTNVLRSAKLYAATLSCSVGSFKELMDSENLQDVFNHKSHENMKTQEVTVTHYEMADVCLILSGMRPTDEHLEQMFEEAATFQANVTGSGNTENVKSQKYIGDRSLSPDRFEQLSSGIIPEGNSDRQSIQHRKLMTHREYNHSAKAHVIEDDLDRKSDNSPTHRRRSSFNSQGHGHSLHRQSSTKESQWSDLPSQKQTRATMENNSSEHGSNLSHMKPNMLISAHEAISLRALVAGSQTFRTFLFKLATDDIFCVLFQTQLGKVRFTLV
jgi:hypothetical protein